MLPSVNGKSLFECSLDDLSVMVDDESYRESDQLDYKKTLAVFEILKENTDEINRKKAEFRKDVCAMANAQGGYLVFGIKEDGKGVPHEVCGITIKDNNTDKFENDVRNILQTILPKIPHYELRFISCGENYVVIMYVHRDYYAPYVFLENNQDYRIYRRLGNRAAVASYSELRAMFNQSLSMDKEILNYRMDRIQFFRQIMDTPEHTYSRFMLLHIIPDTFLDPSYKKNLYVMIRKGEIFIRDMFEGAYCTEGVIPSVDGLRFVSYKNNRESRLFNNGIAEVFYPLQTLLNGLERFPLGRLAFLSLRDTIMQVIDKYLERMHNVLETSRIFVCVSIIGCEGVVTEEEFDADFRGIIDRNELICDPVCFEDYSNDEIAEDAKRELLLNYYLALGIQRSKELAQLIEQMRSSN